MSSISPKCQYWVKAILMYIYYMITALIVIPFGLITRKPMKSASFWALLNRQVSWLLLGLKWKTIGRENIEKNQTYIVVCNQQTTLDVLAVAHIWESLDQCTIVVLKRVKFIPIIGQCMTLIGTVFLQRGNSESSRNALNDAGKRAKESATRDHS